MYSSAYAQFSFEDLNGDGEIRSVAVGDSITFGVGDGVDSNEFVEASPTLPGIIGYPGRLEMLFGFPVDNQGVPGERLTLGYPVRFSNALRSARADYVFILGGSNDANHAIAPAYFRAQLQKLINIARTMGVEPILLTVPPACCDRGGLTTFTRLYSQEVRFLASVNETLLADIEMGFDQECPNTGSCYLLNRPEGLHPNTAGYNFIAEVVGDATIGPDEMGIVEEEPTADEEVEVTP